VSIVAIVLIALVAIVLILLIGGFIANGRRLRDEESGLRDQLEEANRALAHAHAQDRGWERGRLEDAARTAFAERSQADVRDLQLVQVVDRPGTDEDQAVFRVVTDHGAEYLHLDRRGDAWVPR
jgi:Flp pilus assembly protein TadG